MAGLLDFFGNGWDDPKSNAVMALAGGLLDGDFAGGMKGYSQVMAGAGEAKLKRALHEAQIAKYTADTEMDKQKLSMDQAKAKRAGEMESLLMGMFKGNDLGGVVTPNMPVTGSQQPQQMGGAQGRGDAFAGVDRTALMLDYMQNGGKKMGDWVNDRTAPKWENINGNMVNTNAPNFTGGFQAGMKASDNGQMSMWQPDGQGGLIVGAPRGALDTYSAYRNADEAAKARTTTTDYTPPGGLPVRMTKAQELQLINGGQPAQAGSEASMIANGMGGLNGLPTFPRGGTVSLKSTPQEMNAPRILQDALTEATTRLAAAQKLNDTANIDRAQSDIQGIKQEFAKIGGGRPPSLAPNQAPQSAPSFGLPLQPLSEKERTSAENDAYKTKLVEQVKADVTRGTETKEKTGKYSDFLSKLDMAETLLKLKPTASGVGAQFDKSLAYFGKSTTSGDIAAELRAVAAALVSDVPKAPGAQSEAELRDYKAQAADVGNENIPISTRLKAAQGAKNIAKIWIDRIEKGEKAGEDNAKPAPKSLQDYGYKSNSDVIRDAQNTIMRNPQSKAEVERRLQSMGLSLGGK